MNRLVKFVVMVAVLCSMCATVFADVEDKQPQTARDEIVGSRDTEAVATIPTNRKGDVYVKVANAPQNLTVNKVYKVDVKWDSLEFTYDFGSSNQNKSDLEITWDPDNHKYSLEEGNDAVTGWGDKTSANVTVENHSNAAVSVTTTFEDNNDDTIVTNGVEAKLTGVLTNDNGIEDATVNTVTTTSGTALPVESEDDNIKATEIKVNGTNSTTYILRSAVGTDVEKAPTVTNTVSVTGTPEIITNLTDNKFQVGTVVVNISKYSATE
jgi:hypothetical protein